MLDLVNTLFDYGTLAANVALLAYAGLVASGRDGFLVRGYGRYGYRVALAVSCLGVVGSLYYSEIAGWVPCPLCWWQRVALYPIALVLAISIFRDEVRKLAPYVAALACFGAAISVYQIYLQFGPPAAEALMNGCALDGGVSCSEVYHVAFGYVSMATSALSAFLLVLAGMHLGRRADRHHDLAKTSA